MDGRNPFLAPPKKPNGMIRFPCKYQRTMVSTMVLSWFLSGAGFRPSTVFEQATHFPMMKGVMCSIRTLIGWLAGWVVDIGCVG